MPPRKHSRHLYTLAITNSDDPQQRLFLTDRERFFFRVLPDNRQHTVIEGDTLFNLAGRYFAPMPRACGLWWVIADFQPEPIHDPTLKLQRDRLMIIPSLTTVLAEIFNDRRRETG